MNDLITLPSTKADVLHAFDLCLTHSERCYFLVLGDGDGQRQLLAQTAQLTEDWRWAIWAPEPAPLYERLRTLHLRPGVLPLLGSQMPTLLGLSLSSHNVICRVVTQVKPNTVSAAFIMAESYLQP